METEEEKRNRGKDGGWKEEGEAVSRQAGIMDAWESPSKEMRMQTHKLGH